MKWLAAAFACVTAWLMALPAAAQDGRWLRAESPHFIIFSERPERETREALGDLEEFDALLRTMFNVSADATGPKLEVYLYGGRASFERMFGDAGAVAGVYIATPETVSAHAVFRDRGGLDALDVLFHEYTHHFMFQHSSGGYPAWVVEGFAEYFATADIQDQRILLGQFSENRGNWLIYGSWLPLEQLITARVSDLNPDQTAAFYAQSWALMHYCRSDPGRWRALMTYVMALRSSDVDPVAAFTGAFGRPPREVQRDLRSYLGQRLPGVAGPRFLEARTPSVTFTRLPASADQLLALDMRVRRGPFNPEENEALLANVRRISAQYPADAYATVVRARAEIMLGNPADGRALLEPVLVATPNDVSALYLMGLSYINDARSHPETMQDTAVASRRYFARVFRQNPEHVPTLFHYSESHFAAPGPMTPETLNVLMTARNLAPQVDAMAS